ncbi:hypothetical protein WMY93_002996 [Mugilogobius chulae]|uniref:Uncharacterized protein n=1 Tax=Mugilogobius chulae TaxID=88201 RepID=A0AAW0PW72_9GOBI
MHVSKLAVVIKRSERGTDRRTVRLSIHPSIPVPVPLQKHAATEPRQAYTRVHITTEVQSHVHDENHSSRERERERGRPGERRRSSGSRARWETCRSKAEASTVQPNERVRLRASGDRLLAWDRNNGIPGALFARIEAAPWKIAVEIQR